MVAKEDDFGMYNESNVLGKSYERTKQQSLFSDVQRGFCLFVSPREKEIIFNKCNGNPAFVEQAISYCFDCQIADKAFLMPNNFADLIKDRLETLNKLIMMQ